MSKKNGRNTLEIEAPVEFFVTGFTPMEQKADEDVVVELSGQSLSKIKKAFVQIKGVEIELEHSFGEMFGTVKIPAGTVPHNSLFFVVLIGEDNSSWIPIGPMMKTLQS